MKKAFFVLIVSLFAVSVANAGTSSAIFAYTPGLGTPGTLVLNGSSVTASFTGWYDQNGNHLASNPNYIAGICGSSDVCAGLDTNHHDFFVFSIPTGTFTSAVLQIYNPGKAVFDFQNGYICPCPSLNYSNWDVTTPIATLEASNSGMVGIYTVLGSGIQYGSVTVTAASDGTYVNVTLDAAALAAINAAAGGQLAIGGAVNASTAPEPGTITLLVSGLGAGLGMLRHRKLI